MSEPALPTPRAERTWGAVAKDYYEISKPRILFLLLVVAWAAMFIAEDDLPDWKPFLAVTVSGAASVASAGAFNHVLERAKDAKMARTANRPVASGRLSPAAAIVYAVIMAAVSYLALWYVHRPLAAALTLGAIAFYVVIYTVVLKPRTPQNIVLGGAAGSFPALIGWAASTGSIAWPDASPAWMLAGVVFLWTPPHFWALALLYREDYQQAGYPMMPNIRGEASTRNQILLYTLLTVASSIALAVVGRLGFVYYVAALVLGVMFIARAVDVREFPAPAADRGMFFFSIKYLGFLLIAAMADRVIPGF